MNKPNNDNKNFYEKFDWDKADLKSKLSVKIEFLFNSIPNDVNSVIDIGCGDGTITNELSTRFNTVAVDRSKSALAYVSGTKLMASADYLPFKDEHFDLVFSSEMLEHLPDEIFINTINQFKRISKKYIFLTFPNDENIEKNFVKCPECEQIFNKSYHLRTLNLSLIDSLFKDKFVITKSFLLGKPIRKYFPLLSSIKHKFAHSDSWIPKNWTKNIGRKTSCPNCNNEFTYPYRFSFISFSCDLLNTIISKKQPYQIAILLEKSK